LTTANISEKLSVTTQVPYNKAM